MEQKKRKNMDWRGYLEQPEYEQAEEERKEAEMVQAMQRLEAAVASGNATRVREVLERPLPWDVYDVRRVLEDDVYTPWARGQLGWRRAFALRNAMFDALPELRALTGTRVRLFGSFLRARGEDEERATEERRHAVEEAAEDAALARARFEVIDALQTSGSPEQLERALSGIQWSDHQIRNFLRILEQTAEHGGRDLEIPPEEVHRALATMRTLLLEHLSPATAEEMRREQLYEQASRAIQNSGSLVELQRALDAPNMQWTDQEIESLLDDVKNVANTGGRGWPREAAEVLDDRLEAMREALLAHLSPAAHERLAEEAAAAERTRLARLAAPEEEKVLEEFAPPQEEEEEEMLPLPLTPPRLQRTSARRVMPRRRRPPPRPPRPTLSERLAAGLEHALEEKEQVGEEPSAVPIEEFAGEEPTVAVHGRTVGIAGGRGSMARRPHHEEEDPAVAAGYLNLPCYLPAHLPQSFHPARGFRY